MELAQPQQRDPTRGESIYLDLRSRIAAGDLRSGQWVSVRELASQLGVSFAPVADAFRRLQLEGLLESEPGRGSRIVALDLRGLRGEYAVRMAIEAETARRAAELATEDDRAELLRSGELVDEALRGTDPDFAAHDLDVRFHLMIADISGQPMLRRALERSRLRLLLARSSDITRRMGLSPDEVWHVELAEAIAAADPDRASALARRHCEVALRRQVEGLIEG